MRIARLIIDFDSMSEAERDLVEVNFNGAYYFIDGPIPPRAVTRERSVNRFSIPESVTQAPVVTRDDKDETIARLRAEVSGLIRDNERSRAEYHFHAEKVRLALEKEYAEKKRAENKLSNQRSRVALVAKIAEHFAPLLEGFPYSFKECRHIGELVDYIVYDGLEEGEIRNVIFLEVKSRRSGIRVSNPRERMLRDAIDSGRVKYEIFVPKIGNE